MAASIQLSVEETVFATNLDKLRDNSPLHADGAKTSFHVVFYANREPISMCYLAGAPLLQLAIPWPPAELPLTSLHGANMAPAFLICLKH